MKHVCSCISGATLLVVTLRSITITETPAEPSQTGQNRYVLSDWTVWQPTRIIQLLPVQTLVLTHIQPRYIIQKTYFRGLWSPTGAQVIHLPGVLHCVYVEQFPDQTLVLIKPARPAEQKQKSFSSKTPLGTQRRIKRASQRTIEQFHSQSLPNYTKDKLRPAPIRRLSAAKGNQLIRTRVWPGTDSDSCVRLPFCFTALMFELGKRIRFFFCPHMFFLFFFSRRWRLFLRPAADFLRPAQTVTSFSLWRSSFY